MSAVWQFWCVPDAVSGEWLERVQACFRAAQAPARALWEAAKAARETHAYTPGNTGTGQRDSGSEHHDLGEPRLGEALAGRHAAGYFDVPRFIEQDESLLRWGSRSDSSPIYTSKRTLRWVLNSLVRNRLMDAPKVLPIIEAVMGGASQTFVVSLSGAKIIL
jgi:hypothetical protein